MRRIFVLLFVSLLLLLQTACNTNEWVSCFGCSEKYQKGFGFCADCASALSKAKQDGNNNNETEAEIDYADFGFENNHGMTEWLEIDAYDFEDSNNAYILVIKNSGYYVKVLENGYYTRRYFGAMDNDPCYEGDSSCGDLVDAYPYAIVNNNLIRVQEPTGTSLWEITVSTERGIPIVEDKQDDNPLGLLPTDFIDWSRGVERVEKNGQYSTIVYFKYYIKQECLD